MPGHERTLVGMSINDNHYSNGPIVEPSPSSPARGWWHTAVWIPVGFAATRLLGEIGRAHV